MSITRTRYNTGYNTGHYVIAKITKSILEKLMINKKKCRVDDEYNL